MTKVCEATFGRVAVIGREIFGAHHRFSRETTFESLKADNLDFVELEMDVEIEFALEVPEGAFNSFATLGELCDWIEAQS